jgi:hypothetical protein
LALLGPDATSEFNVIKPYQVVGTQAAVVRIQVTLPLMVTNAACVGGNNLDACKVKVCLTRDGVACDAHAKLYEQAVTNSIANYNFGSGVYGDAMQATGYRLFNDWEVAKETGQVTCDGSSTVTWFAPAGGIPDARVVLQSGYAPFRPFWTNGSPIIINSIPYVISSVANTRLLTLTSNCPAGQWSYSASTYGILVSKKISDGNTLSVGAASISGAQGSHRAPDDFSGTVVCSENMVAGVGGELGHNCVANNGYIEWVGSVTGKVHPLAFGGFTGSGISLFDRNNPDIWYKFCIPPGDATVCSTSHMYHIIKLQYQGDHDDTTTADFWQAGTGLQPFFWEYTLDGAELFACNGTTHTNHCYAAVTDIDPGVGNDVPSLATAFNPLFDSANYTNWLLSAVDADGTLVFQVNYKDGAQGRGWVVIFNPSVSTNSQSNAGCVPGGGNGCVVATASTHANGCRWCNLKAVYPGYVPGGGWVIVQPYYDMGYNGFSGYSYGSWIVNGTMAIPTSTTTCPANDYGQTNNCVTFTVDGEPYSQFQGTGARGAWGNAAIGDIAIMPNAVGASGDYNQAEEELLLLAKSGNSWTFARHYSGSGNLSDTTSTPVLQFICATEWPRDYLSSKASLWNWANDPLGLNGGHNIGNFRLFDRNSTNSHSWSEVGKNVTSYTEDTRCTNNNSCYTAVGIPATTFVSGLLATRGTLTTGLIPQNPGFHGVDPPLGLGPNNIQAHPSSGGNLASGPGANFFFDSKPIIGIDDAGGTKGAPRAGDASLVTGQLYRTPASALTYLPLHRKYLPTYAMAGRYFLKDVSGPGSVIASDSTGNYTYCVAVLANECRSGSGVGDVYANIPQLTFPYCRFIDQAYQQYFEPDMCFFDNGASTSGVNRFPMLGFDQTGIYAQFLGHTLTRPRDNDAFWHTHVLPTGTQLWAQAPRFGDLMQANITIPVPSVHSDSVNRTRFIPIIVSGRATGAATNVVVEFGYAENGGIGTLFCTTRQENCVIGPATNSTQIQSTPFWFKTSESTSISGTPCTSGCQIAIPALPNHVLYWRFAYRDVSGTILNFGPTNIVPVN